MAEKQKHTVLVVEDVDEISLNMSAALNKRGHRVVQASTAEQAIRMAEADRPSMILTDLDLPTFDQLLNLLHGHDGLSNMVVAIYVSIWPYRFTLFSRSSPPCCCLHTTREGLICSWWPGFTCSRKFAKQPTTRFFRSGT